MRIVSFQSGFQLFGGVCLCTNVPREDRSSKLADTCSGVMSANDTRGLDAPWATTGSVFGEDGRPPWAEGHEKFRSVLVFGCFGVWVFWCFGVWVFRWCSSGVQVVFMWCSCGVQVVFRWFSGGVQVVLKRCSGGVQVVFGWCSNGVQMVFRWCSSGVQ